MSFKSKNACRVHLIRKDLSEGLTEGEAIELGRLEGEVDDYVNSVTPLPFAKLENLERRAHEAEECAKTDCRGEDDGPSLHA